MHVSSNGHSDGLFYLLIGGPVAVFWGLRLLNKKRLIENTPTSKVRSAAMGLVELAGLARQRKPQKAPLSGMDCCWWDCQVQEWRSSGKNSHWVTIKQVASVDLFYLDDLTGRVLINPLGAELRVLSNPFDLNSSTRTRMAPVLTGWGLNDMNWFGGVRKLRVVERSIPEGAPLYVLGELVSLGAHLEDRQARLVARLRAIKSSPTQLAAADTNQDGVVDGEEWDALREKQETLFLKEELSRSAQMPNADSMLLKAPASSPFVISTGTEGDVLGSMRWLAPLSLFGGIALCAAGVWWARLDGWSPLFIVGLLGAGTVMGLFFKKISFNFGGIKL